MSAADAAQALGPIAPLLSEAERAELIKTLIKAMKDKDWMSAGTPYEL